MADTARPKREQAIAPSAVPLIVGPINQCRDGVMANLIRAHDWNTTPLGPLAGWSETLIATVNMALHSPFPTIVAWGPEMVFLYNVTPESPHWLENIPLKRWADSTVTYSAKPGTW